MRFIKAILLISLFALVACSDETKVKQGDAYQEIIVSIAYKAQECGNMPSYVLIMPEKPPANGVDLCSMAIIGQPCPFTNYPFLCLSVYGVKTPGFGSH